MIIVTIKTLKKYIGTVNTIPNKLKFAFKNVYIQKTKVKININLLINIKNIINGSINQLDIFKRILNVNNW